MHCPRCGLPLGIVADHVPPSFGLWKVPDTGEIVPHNVTDKTTKLL